MFIPKEAVLLCFSPCCCGEGKIIEVSVEYRRLCGVVLIFFFFLCKLTYNCCGVTGGGAFYLRDNGKITYLL